MAPDDIPDEDMQAEIEMGAEELLGRPLSGSPEQRLDALQSRLKYLHEQIATVSAPDFHDPDFAADELPRLRAQLAEALRQFAEWRTQHTGRN